MKTLKPKPTIEDGIPIPMGRGQYSWLKETLIALRPNQSFIVASDAKRTSVLSRAKELKIKVTTRKINGEGYRIWRVK